ncbi:hypothetical protein P8452_47076 [Trifolium repens]|nr:hypothetical protein P8452_47076 [Trifolium repens]
MEHRFPPFSADESISASLLLLHRRIFPPLLTTVMAKRKCFPYLLRSTNSSPQALPHGLTSLNPLPQAPPQGSTSTNSLPQGPTPVDSSSTHEIPRQTQTSRQRIGRESAEYWTVEAIASCCKRIACWKQHLILF